MPRHLLGVRDLDRGELSSLVAETLAPTGGPLPITAGLFFLEPSTRTRIGFEVAVARLGGRSVVVGQLKETGAMSASESWPDTIRSVGAYFDLLCIRHPDPAAARVASLLTEGVAVVNCGNGADEHPTQAVADVATLADRFGTIPSRLRVTVVGDLLHMRAAHSLVLALGVLGGADITGVSPSKLSMPAEYLDQLDGTGCTYRTTSSLDDTLDTDVLYMAGFAPRTPAGEWDDDARSPYRLTARRTARLRPDSVVLCPLPRVDEIDPEVDEMPQAAYFRQSHLALPARMAVIRRCIVPDS